MRLIDADALILDIFNLRNCSNGYSDVYDKGCIIGIIEGQQTVELEPPEDKCSECDAWNKYKNYPQEQRWISATISPKVSGKYLVTHGGNYNLSLDAYTTMEDAVRIFDEGYEDYIGWQSQNVIAWMPLPKPYQEEGE